MHQPEDVLASVIGYSTEDDEDFYNDFQVFIDHTVEQTLREEHRISQNKNNNWQIVPSLNACQIMRKKVGYIFTIITNQNY